MVFISFPKPTLSTTKLNPFNIMTITLLLLVSEIRNWLFEISMNPPTSAI